MHPYTMALIDSLPGLEKNKRLTPISGSVPPPFLKPSGCLFHPRCKYFKRGICDTGSAPQLEEVIKGHQTACLRIKEIKQNAE
jgi:oligopeptide transport system ATP-binding protein